MSVLICGSIAFDTIMNFDGRFADQLLPDQLHNINVSFLVPGLRRDFGGCAGNIAYALRQLGGAPLPMATVGIDGADYIARLQSQGISTEFVRQMPGMMTAQAMIMTDTGNNQITAFHPGAMTQAHINTITARDDIRLGIVSPDGREAMQQHAAQFHAAGIPFVFDPGQMLPAFNGEELLRFVELADWVAVNDYEAQMLCERTGLSLADLSQRVRGLAVTLGEQGCDIWEGGQKQHVPAVPAAQIADPTGCGDAWRGALLYGLEQGWSLARCAALGNRIGAIKIAVAGPQNYQLDRQALLAQA
ncbi:MAG: carbohydrate kinase family protein [Ottowia sp.]